MEDFECEACRYAKRIAPSLPQQLLGIRLSALRAPADTAESGEIVAARGAGAKVAILRLPEAGACESLQPEIASSHEGDGDCICNNDRSSNDTRIKEEWDNDGESNKECPWNDGSTHVGNIGTQMHVALVSRHMCGWYGLLAREQRM